MTQKIQRYISVVFLCRECLWVINVEAHAAHCRMPSTTITVAWRTETVVVEEADGIVLQQHCEEFMAEAMAVA